MENYAVVSLFGMAPYQFEVDSSLIINEDGDVSVSMEAEYDYRYVNKPHICNREYHCLLHFLSQNGLIDLLGLIQFVLAYAIEWRSHGNLPRILVLIGLEPWERQRIIYVVIGDPVHETGVVLGARVWF